MTNQYKIERDRLLGELSEIEKNKDIQNALNKQLPNDSDATDYEAWLKGSAKFAKDNNTLLKALAK